MAAKIDYRGRNETVKWSADEEKRQKTCSEKANQLSTGRCSNELMMLRMRGGSSLVDVSIILWGV
jgi:hypothetical protein